MRTLAPGSRRTQRECLDHIASLMKNAKTSADEVSWHLMRYEHTSEVRERMCKKGWSASYINKHLAALRRVLKEAWLLRLMSAEDYQAAINVPAVKGTRVPRGKHIPADVVSTAVGELESDGTHLATRNAAILALFRYTGMRRAELGWARVEDYDREAGEIRVIGKGNRERRIPLDGRAVRLLEAWLAVRGDASGPLFIPLGGKFVRESTSRERYLCGQAIADIVKKIDATPHDFRRTLVGDLLDANVDPATIMDITGHASYRVMLGYDRRKGARARDALAKLA
ncbi:tyrosine-type recombinase/integrase [Nonomuraea sp. SYSU D8015]|uniref:tyrosine-type recombinase/integrase n=1 Tax=Nonomuraea sp. SYSU D8015 TaxID=2593644 RepID=UPI001661663F|nr:site-specific integrase [Nonomuraea sp. SYSU D8015]